jgi:RNA polymerase sigma-70 factor (ECF subfamily)
MTQSTMEHRFGSEKHLAATDFELIAAFQGSGNRPALETLIRRHIGFVRAVIYPMVLDDNLVDDLTQDTFIRAVRGLASFRRDSEFSTWLCAIATNCVRSYCSRRPPAAAPLEADLTSSRNERPESAAMGQEMDLAINRALEQLTPKLRAAVVLISLNGLDAAQAAALEGCTAATMHSRLHEARRHLKRLLKGHLS